MAYSLCLSACSVVACGAPTAMFCGGRQVACLPCTGREGGGLNINAARRGFKAPVPGQGLARAGAGRGDAASCTLAPGAGRPVLAECVSARHGESYGHNCITA